MQFHLSEMFVHHGIRLLGGCERKIESDFLFSVNKSLLWYAHIAANFSSETPKFLAPSKVWAWQYKQPAALLAT
jgi:hypothetical protein